MEAIIENVSDSVFILRPDLKIHCKNAAACEITSQENGYFPEVIANNAGFTEAIAILDEESQNEKHITVEFKDKNSTFADIRISKIKDWFGDNSGYLVICRETPGLRHFKKLYKISTRQMEIIMLSIEGLSNNEISEKLNISRRTIETHFFYIYTKLNISNKVELIKLTNKFTLVE